MDDDPSCVAANVTKFNLISNEHSLHVLCGLCFFVLFQRCTGM